MIFWASTSTIGVKEIPKTKHHSRQESETAPNTICNGGRVKTVICRIRQMINESTSLLLLNIPVLKSENLLFMLKEWKSWERPNTANAIVRP